MKTEIFYATEKRRLVHLQNVDKFVNIKAVTPGGTYHILENNDVVAFEDGIPTSIETGVRYQAVYELCYVNGRLTREKFVGYTDSAYTFGDLHTVTLEDTETYQIDEYLLFINREPGWL